MAHKLGRKRGVQRTDTPRPSEDEPSGKEPYRILDRRHRNGQVWYLVERQTWVNVESLFDLEAVKTGRPSTPVDREELDRTLSVDDEEMVKKAFEEATGRYDTPEPNHIGWLPVHIHIR